MTKYGFAFKNIKCYYSILKAAGLNPLLAVFKNIKCYYSIGKTEKI